MFNNPKLKYIKDIDGMEFYHFTPTLGHWFFEDWVGFEEDKDKHSRKQRIRMLIEWLWGGYSAYYAGQGEKLFGYVLVARGGRRITCSKKSDIVLGPYYTLSEERGHGIMESMLNTVLHELDIHYKNAFCYIRKDNVASIRVASKCGFKIIGQAEMRGALRKLYLTENENSKFYIVKYEKM